ncbi:hypothetical protein [Bordetella bronchialis]|uniref:Uncharacterized protein n=2 Tax=Bordetella bronchialis TaxID=463025 RepID=A0ABM6CQJ1_9BORD|nr:hypothetical protein [Bordetella bronchialis]ANN66250.1 hypothetical protein BAU06_08055 [Bordetella bronchialis]
MFLNTCSPPAPATAPLPQDVAAPPELPPQVAGWILSYPTCPATPSPARGTVASADGGAVLNLHIVADVPNGHEPLRDALAVIDATVTGRGLLADLACKLASQSIEVVRADTPRQAGLTADPQGRLRLSLAAGTLPAHGERMRAHGGCPPFSAQERDACGLFEFLLDAMNYFTMGTFGPGKRIDIHPETGKFRQALLDATRHAPAAFAAAASPDQAGPGVGLHFNVDSGMARYREGFRRMLTTLRAVEPGKQLCRDIALAIPAQAMEVYHVDHPGDAGILLGHNNVVFWYYNIDAIAAHAALLHITDDDLSHEERDACAAFDLLRKSWESLAREPGHLQPGDRLDLDLARRAFRGDLMNIVMGRPAAGAAATATALRV